MPFTIYYIYHLVTDPFRRKRTVEVENADQETSTDN